MLLGSGGKLEGRPRQRGQAREPVRSAGGKFFSSSKTSAGKSLLSSASESGCRPQPTPMVRSMRAALRFRVSALILSPMWTLPFTN